MEEQEKQEKASPRASDGSQIYAFVYNSNIHESSWATVSLHYSREGAEEAMRIHRQKRLDAFNKYAATYNREFVYKHRFKFGEHEGWEVETVKILP
jgi:hypothetical protein